MPPLTPFSPLSPSPNPSFASSTTHPVSAPGHSRQRTRTRTHSAEKAGLTSSRSTASLVRSPDSASDSHDSMQSFGSVEHGRHALSDTYLDRISRPAGHPSSHPSRPYFSADDEATDPDSDDSEHDLVSGLSFRLRSADFDPLPTDSLYLGWFLPSFPPVMSLILFVYRGDSDPLDASSDWRHTT